MFAGVFIPEEVGGPQDKWSGKMKLFIGKK